MTFGRQILNTIARNPISAFAVLCVAATSAFLGWITYRMLRVLESADWCSNALKAERISTETKGGLTSCVDLLKTQLEAVATGFHISTGGFVFVLVVLIVVVVAGAKANFKLGKDGIEGNVSRDVEDAADEVAEAAVDKAEEIKA
jgi:hypothetical protein